MKLLKMGLEVMALFFMIPVSLMGQGYDLQFIQMVNDGTNFKVKIQIKADTSTFRLGTSNLVFDYTGAISAPKLDSVFNFNGGFYNPMTLTTPATNRVSINMDYAGSTGNGTTVQLSYVDVCEVLFTTDNPSGTATLTWRRTSPNACVVFKDDQTNLVPAVTLNGITVGALPITLSTFSAQMGEAGQSVRLAWTTLSEINNYGFYVQRQDNGTGSFKDIPNSFIPGHGTTLKPFSYSYIDNTIKPSTSYQYRLKQQDLDGTIHYTSGVMVNTTVLSVKEAAPREFRLLQNYPNPFNPETEIKFSVETSGRATMKVYNLLGQEVATLFDEFAEAGQYYKVRFGGNGFASGVYFFRLQSQQKSDLKKMLLLK